MLQAGCVAAPRAIPRVAWLQRFRGWGWALVPIASIVGVIFAIRYASDTATWLTYLALIAVPGRAIFRIGAELWSIVSELLPKELLEKWRHSVRKLTLDIGAI